MKWVPTSGQTATAITLIFMIQQTGTWPSTVAFSFSVLLVCLETYLVARSPQNPSAELQKQVQELKDQIGNINLALAMRRE